MVFSVLNKLKWTGQLTHVHVVIEHRGAPENRKIITGNIITEIKKVYFVVRDETVIPLHRVREIRVDEKQVWPTSAATDQ